MNSDDQGGQTTVGSKSLAIQFNDLTGDCRSFSPDRQSFNACRCIAGEPGVLHDYGPENAPTLGVLVLYQVTQ